MHVPMNHVIYNFMRNSQIISFVDKPNCQYLLFF